MKLTPLFDRLLVQRVQPKKETEGKIIIPDSAQEPATHARVIAVGNGFEMNDGNLRDLFVKPGDVVLIGKYDGVPVKDGGEDYVFIREADVLAIVAP